MKQSIIFLLVSLLSFNCIAQISKIESDSIKQSNARQIQDTTEVNFNSFTVFFPTAKYEVEEKYYSDLNRIANHVISSKDSLKFFGYTDNVGDSTDNYALSKLRSESIQDFFSNKGVPLELMQSSFFGENSPKADNSTSQGRAQNRRVEIKIVPDRIVYEIVPTPTSTPNPDTTNIPTQPTEKKEVTTIDAQVLQDNIKMPDNAKKISNKQVPDMKRKTIVQLKSTQRRWTTSNGSTIMIGYEYSSGDAAPQKLLVQVNGADGFFDIPVDRLATKGTLNVPIGFPTNLDKGEFDVIAVLITKKGKLSKRDTTTVEVERLGTGKLQVSLSWDTQTDQDLYVKTPGKETISYLDYWSDCGGRLDRDDTDGFGPENVFWKNTAPDGIYTISVHDYQYTRSKNSFIVTINGMGVERQFSGTTQLGSKVQVVKFRKKGNEIIWKDENTKVLRSGKK